MAEKKAMSREITIIVYQPEEIKPEKKSFWDMLLEFLRSIFGQ